MTLNRLTKAFVTQDVIVVEVALGGLPTPWRTGRTGRLWRPSTDVYETEEEIVVQMEIAGMRPEDFKLALHDRRLLISGVRYSPDEHQSASPRAYHQMEVNYGDFRSEVELPIIVDGNQARAEYRNGLLSVVFPKRPLNPHTPSFK